MPAVTREISITYGGFAIGGPTDRLLDGSTKLRISKSFTDASIEFAFVVTAGSDQEFVGACADAEAAFRKPHQDLLVVFGGQTVLSLTHTGNDGFLALPQISKEGDDADTTRSRVYRVRIEFELPADNESPTGLREADIEVAYNPSRRRTVTISGTFTAISGTEARANYEAKIDSYATSILTALGGTYERIDEKASTEKEDKLCDFAVVYEEVLFSQGGAATDDAALTRQLLVISRSTVAPGDTDFGGARYAGTRVDRPVEIEVSYSASVRADETTNLRAKYASIRGWIISQAKTVAGGGTVVVLEETPEYEFDENRINAKLRLLAIPGDVLENSVEVTDSLDVGERLVPVWSGDRFAKYRYAGPAELIRTVSQTVVLLGSLTQFQAVGKVYPILASFSGEPPNLAPLGGGGGKWVEKNRTIGPAKRERFGTVGNDATKTTITATLTMEFYREVDGGGGGGGTTTPTTTVGGRTYSTADAGPTNTPTPGLA